MNTHIKPFIKWVGGKRQLIPQMEKYLPKSSENYFEPFVGAGALFFHMLPNNANINDMNEELINTYKVIRNDIDNLIDKLNIHEKNNTAEYFYSVRIWDRQPGYSRRSNTTKAARFIYMNKVGFNGLYRVNLKGQFNVPYGTYTNPKICDENLLRDISKYFNEKNIHFTSLDFEEAVKGAKSGSFVYFDPPYDPLSKTSSFTQYQKGGFDREEQKRLKCVADRLVHKGAKVILSNSNTEFIKDLYKNKIDDAKSDVDYFIVELVDAKRSINSKADGRGKIKEVLIISKD
ncbi:DNA adenine methylase [Mariniplasma anaerobium]|uniref:Site-specific DNA-methyltransferase (adenine-specific) n=1 Tax=Mariniplasma anaerobium TaxID=2735436 RepID=A0A7U9TKL3_9MOLU|nr:DNA adenine methylase [Mariniplasma anaerobium]BCR36672.1 site-specific DNA-methyltransferase (adenine-specific) [Mariniplasma anaerobium]